MGDRVLKSDARRAAVWDGMLRLGAFTIDQLAAEVGGGTNGIRGTVAEWEAEGLVRRDGLKGKSVKYRIMSHIAVDSAPGTPAELCWRAARVMTTFSPASLALHASTSFAPVTAEEAEKHCRAWLRGGYLRVLEKAQPGRRPAVYHLIRNTGPNPPVERRVSAIWDPNLCEYTHVAEPRA